MSVMKALIAVLVIKGAIIRKVVLSAHVTPLGDSQQRGTVLMVSNAVTCMFYLFIDHSSATVVCTSCDTDLCADIGGNQGICLCLKLGTYCVGDCEGDLQALQDGTQNCNGKDLIENMPHVIQSTETILLCVQSVSQTCMAIDVGTHVTVYMGLVIQSVAVNVM